MHAHGTLVTLPLPREGQNPCFTPPKRVVPCRICRTSQLCRKNISSRCPLVPAEIPSFFGGGPEAGRSNRELFRAKSSPGSCFHLLAKRGTVSQRTQTIGPAAASSGSSSSNPWCFFFFFLLFSRQFVVVPSFSYH